MLAEIEGLVSYGKYVTFADSDDWNHPDRLKDSAQIIEQRNVDAVMGRFLRWMCEETSNSTGVRYLNSV